MEDRLYEALIARLDRIESKLGEHLDDASATRAEIAVLRAELRLVKFVAGGLGMAFLTLVAEAGWRLIVAG